MKKGACSGQRLHWLLEQWVRTSCPLTALICKHVTELETQIHVRICARSRHEPTGHRAECPRGPCQHRPHCLAPCLPQHTPKDPTLTGTAPHKRSAPAPTTLHGKLPISTANWPNSARRRPSLRRPPAGGLPPGQRTGASAPGVTATSEMDDFHGP